jgi:hypothetical protein
MSGSPLSTELKAVCYEIFNESRPMTKPFKQDTIAAAYAAAEAFERPRTTQMIYTATTQHDPQDPVSLKQQRIRLGTTTRTVRADEGRKERISVAELDRWTTESKKLSCLHGIDN